ncbi:hypothetical protein COCON_G00010590 [Conger conger]|uniref:Fucolectin tachylectin-4 pentraxin-1 domain-containing protein n=1 Tax=Conger conger TaxID=82655 RepID=A0A9Q1E2G0_CONCO|nr:hypothetical protein COCON_G00010590 [Conger conger]
MITLLLPSEQLGAELRIGNSLENNGNNNPICTVISSFPAWETLTFQCHEMEGRYVNILLPGCHKYLTLCEVEVNAQPVPVTEPDSPPEDIEEILSAFNGFLEFFQLFSEAMIPEEDRITNDTDGHSNRQCTARTIVQENAATSGHATQSTQWDSFGDAKNAIDRNLEGEYLKGSCSHTKAETNPWWRVDLLKSYSITSVSITNRKDCCSERINGAEIHIGNSLENNGNDNPVCAVIPYIPADQTRTYECHGMEGRYVSIVLPGKEKYLTLCEVEVNSSFIENA